MKKFLLWAAGLVTLLVLAATVAAWLSRRSWLQEKAALTAAGKLPTVESLLPPPVPDEENFAAIPVLRREWEHIAKERGAEEVVSSTDFVPVPELMLIPEGKKSANYGLDLTKRLDLAAALPGFRSLAPLPGEAPAATVLRSLEPLTGLLQEFSEGLRRPACRFPVRYERTIAAVQPSVLFFRSLAQLFGLRAAARLELGQVDAAAEDALAAVRLGRHFRRDPGFLRVGVGSAMPLPAIWVIRHGLARHAWTARHLEAFARELADHDMFAELARSARFESALAIQLWESALQEPNAFRNLVSLASAVSERVVTLAYGEAAYYRCLAVLARNCVQLQLTLPARRPDRFEPTSLLAGMREIEAASTRWDGMFVSLSLLSYQRLALRLTAVQSSLELARSALRLEQEYLVHGRYPATTEGLGIPDDFLTGRPRRYEVSADGQRFRLRGEDWAVAEGDTMNSLLPGGWGEWDSSFAPGGWTAGAGN